MNKDQEVMWNRLKEPAPIIDKVGNQRWYNKADQLHRENDLPAVIYKNGSKEWWKNGKRHRENDMPAVININGYNAWLVNGVSHRENDKPATIWADGSRFWYKNDELIRSEKGDE